MTVTIEGLGRVLFQQDVPADTNQRVLIALARRLNVIDADELTIRIGRKTVIVVDDSYLSRI